jgi:hypothetical protein
MTLVEIHFVKIAHFVKAYLLKGFEFKYINACHGFVLVATVWFDENSLCSKCGKDVEAEKYFEIRAISV